LALPGLIGLWLPMATGCGTERVEYHRRPSYYRSMAGGDQPDRVTLDDGTVLVYQSRAETSELQREADGDDDGSGSGGQRFQIREEMDDGTIVLRAVLPQHVLANTLTCLRNQEYDLVWEQLLADQTRRAYAARNQGPEEFEAFFSANRVELAATLTRMLMGLSRGEAFMENVGGGIVRFRFHPRVGSQFRFKTAEVISEGGGLHLLMIR
jgi:hypothetical protein